jgi:HK97 family phage portal protein
MGALFGRSAPTQTRAANLSALLAAAEVDVRGAAGLTGVPATPSQSMRHSGVWAAIRLRANLISTLPVDGFTKTGTLGAQVQKPAPLTPLFTRPAAGMLWHEWVYATQADLDRYGNAFGRIVARQNGWPVQVELWSAADVTVRGAGMLVTEVRHGGRAYDPVDVWHERQYLAAGVPLGLSPIAHAAWSTGTYLSAQQFALDWFSNGAHPSGTLRHTQAAELDPKLLDAVKARFKAAVAGRDLFATGSEWEYTPNAVDASTAQFLEQMTYGITDVARWFDVPATAIDGSPNGHASLSYANVTADNLQLLVRHLAPAITRRELTLSANALPQPRFAKFNTDALLRLDPMGRTDLMAKQADAGFLTIDEARELENRPPLTPEQWEQYLALKSARKGTPADGEDSTDDQPA